MTEIDALKSIDEALSTLEADQRSRVLHWVIDKYGVQWATVGGGEQNIASRAKKKKNTQSPRSKKSFPRTKVSLSINKDLDLKPKGKTSFADLVSEKSPRSNPEKCTLAVYYLKRVLGRQSATADDVYTCFKGMGWRLPADLKNAMQFTASQNGWLDTSSSNDLKITVLGENHIEHDLPRKGVS